MKGQVNNVSSVQVKDHHTIEVNLNGHQVTESDIESIVRAVVIHRAQNPKQYLDDTSRVSNVRFNVSPSLLDFETENKIVDAKLSFKGMSGILDTMQKKYNAFQQDLEHQKKSRRFSGKIKGEAQHNYVI